MREIKLSPSITQRDTDSVQRYLADIARIPMLSIDEEVRLAKKIREGDPGALERLVNANLRFVVSVAKNYQGRGLSLGDLINEGNMGLIKAAMKFDHTKGFKFISFAVWWIRQTITLAIAEQTRVIRLPLNLINSISRINNVTSVLEQHLEREPTAEEVAAEISLTEFKVKDYISSSARALSLEATLNKHTETTVMSSIADQVASPDHQLRIADQQHELRKLLRGLSKKEGTVIQLHFGLSGKFPMSLSEIGLLFHLSKERIRQIRDRAIKKIRSRYPKNFH